ncbi:MAG: hypothetical protein KF779_04955 [Hyphomonadaceae bacterium]|nr:hypothetical protein [Hyphomonadaceae bacterium]
MKYVLAAAIFAMFVGSAVAQETPPAAPVPPSSCAAFTPAPTAPDASHATAEQMNAAVASYQSWQATTQATLDCRSAERHSLSAQFQARTAELEAANAANQAAADAFQAQLDAFHARRNRH